MQTAAYHYGRLADVCAVFTRLFAAVPSVSGRVQVNTNSLSALLSPKKKDATSKLAKASLISPFRDPRVATSTAIG